MSTIDLASHGAPRPRDQARQSAWSRPEGMFPFEVLCILPALLATVAVIVAFLLG